MVCGSGVESLYACMHEIMMMMIMMNHVDNTERSHSACRRDGSAANNHFVYVVVHFTQDEMSTKKHVAAHTGNLDCVL